VTAGETAYLKTERRIMETLKTTIVILMLIGCFAILLRSSFKYAQHEPAKEILGYMPEKFVLQQLINERLAPDMRIRVDGQIGTDTLDAWDYVLAEDHNQVEIDKAHVRWAIPEIDLTKGAE